MRIGILSDTHGKSKQMQHALAVLAGRGVQAVVHCGDIADVRDVGALAGAVAGAGVPAYLVAGNMDRHLVASLAATAEKAGVTFAADFVTVPLGDGRYLTATHGHHEELLDELIAGGQYPYVCHGHSHARRDVHIGPTRVINPGALFHPRDRHGESVCLLDTQTDTVEFIKI